MYPNSFSYSQSQEPSEQQRRDAFRYANPAKSLQESFPFLYNDKSNQQFQAISHFPYSSYNIQFPRFQEEGIPEPPNPDPSTGFDTPFPPAPPPTSTTSTFPNVTPDMLSGSPIIPGSVSTGPLEITGWPKPEYVDQMEGYEMTGTTEIGVPGTEFFPYGVFESWQLDFLNDLLTGVNKNQRRRTHRSYLIKIIYKIRHPVRKKFNPIQDIRVLDIEIVKG